MVDPSLRHDPSLRPAFATPKARLFHSLKHGKVSSSPFVVSMSHDDNTAKSFYPKSVPHPATDARLSQVSKFLSPNCHKSAFCANVTENTLSAQPTTGTSLSETNHTAAFAVRDDIERDTSSTRLATSMSRTCFVACLEKSLEFATPKAHLFQSPKQNSVSMCSASDLHNNTSATLHHEETPFIVSHAADSGFSHNSDMLSPNLHHASSRIITNNSDYATAAASCYMPKTSFVDSPEKLFSSDEDESGGIEFSLLDKPSTSRQSKHYHFTFFVYVTYLSIS